MKKGNYFLFLVLFFCFCVTVNASTYVQPDVGLLFNNSTVNELAITNTTTGSDFNIKVAVSESTPAYFLIDVCSSQNYKDIEITNSSCNTSCVASGSVTAYKVGTCTINGYNANHVLLQLQVQKYAVDPNTTYYQAESRIRFGGYGYYTRVVINNYYASDTDVITALANGQQQYEDLTNSINSQTSSINNSINSSTNSINNNISNGFAGIGAVMGEEYQKSRDQAIQQAYHCEPNTVINEKYKAIDNSYLYSDGRVIHFDGFFITDYLFVRDLRVDNLTGYAPSVCFYGLTKNLLSCVSYGFMSAGNITIPNNAFYVRFSIADSYDPVRPVFTGTVCKNYEDLELEEQQKINSAINNIADMDIGSSEKQLPDNSAFNSYEQKENQLKTYINQADTSALDIAMDTNANTWIWDTLTSLIQSNMLVFGMFIAILSIGVIKLALGR